MTVGVAKKSIPQYLYGNRYPDAKDGNLADSIDALGGGKKKTLDSGSKPGVAIGRFRCLCESPPPCPFAVPPLGGGSRFGV